MRKVAFWLVSLSFYLCNWFTSNEDKNPRIGKCRNCAYKFNEVDRYPLIWRLWWMMDKSGQLDCFSKHPFYPQYTETLGEFWVSICCPTINLLFYVDFMVDFNGKYPCLEVQRNEEYWKSDSRNFRSIITQSLKGCPISPALKRGCPYPQNLGFPLLWF